MIVWVEAVGCTNGCRCCQLKSRPPYQVFYSAMELQQLAEVWGPLVLLDDATVHPEFPEVLNRSITPKGHTYLGTNGEGIAQSTNPQAVLRQLRAHGYEGLYFAVHGLEHWHDWFVGRQGAFQSVVQATRRASEAGFYIHWEVYLNRHNLKDTAPLVRLANQTFGGSPHLNLLNHRLHPHLAWYETLRPSLRQVQEHLPGEMIAERWGSSLETLTEANWVLAWQNRSDEEAFKHPFEPRSWPVSPSFDNQCISITRDGQVYFNAQCSPPAFLGKLSEDRSTLMKRLQQLSEPCPDLRESWPSHLHDEDRDLLHSSGHSVRYKAVSTALCSGGKPPDGIGGLDFCGHF